MNDPYEALGVPKDASQEEIKRAYKKKAKQNHPDREGGDTSAMAAVNQAYDLLSDAEKRAKFDKTGSTDKPPTIEERAMQSLAKAFDDMLSDEAPSGDVVAIIDKGIKLAMRNLEIEIKKIDSYLTRLEKKAKLVSKKGDGGIDLWTNVIVARRERYIAKRAANVEALEISKKALEILGEYADAEQPPEPSSPPPAAPYSNSLFADWERA